MTLVEQRNATETWNNTEEIYHANTKHCIVSAGITEYCLSLLLRSCTFIKFVYTVHVDVIIA